jgi:KDO2-lipid IV(A) lauroyltransferase
MTGTAAATATYLAYATGWRAVRLMPEAAAYALFERIADQQWRSGGGAVRQLERNLARVVGPVPDEQLRELTREGMRSYLRYWCDAFRMPGWSAERIASFELRSSERILEPLGRGRGVIAALAHMGNWDHAGAYFSGQHAQVVTVAERLEPARLFEAFLAYRESLGMRILGLGEPGVFDELARTLDAGGFVPLLADRDLSAKGVPVTFFGEPTRFPAGPAALAIDTGSVLLPVGLHWEPDGAAGRGGRNVGVVLPEVVPPAQGERSERIRVATQAVATALEGAIRAHPQDWHMLQRLWLADLDQDRLAARDAAEREAADRDGPGLDGAGGG